MSAPLRIAVTGAGGFCGSHVARAAAALGLDVDCHGRTPGPVGRHVHWDATTGDPDLGAADVVVHCAAAVADLPPGSPGEARQYAVNVTGTERLMRAALGRPVVWVSSASVYDPRTTRVSVTEDHPTRGGHLNAYGRTKAAGERIALEAGAVVLRPRAVYGPGDPHLVPQLLSRVRRGLLVLPGGDVRISLTAVQNLADACLTALGLTAPAHTAPDPTAPGQTANGQTANGQTANGPTGRIWPPGAYNIADARPYRRDDAVRAVLAAHGVRARIAHVPVPLARLAARTGRFPGLTRYAVDQLAHEVTLDLGRARAQGWHPARDLTAVLRPARTDAVDD
ncbi:NAD-dependent epimerase/dehydratase family protein [Kitasatospora sp. NPDC058170]|uniref:NAD-dependent epimerase/dehydratase family protein n=1 Tax=Kitasatospora sp. NPDC058170 TaxID=3346364 RepID=UPI0036D9A786